MVVGIVPGLGFGLVLMSSAEDIRYPLGGISFILLSVGINIGCVALVLIDFMKPGQYVPFWFVACSAFGAVLLTVCYDLLLVGRFSPYYTISIPAILGIVASLPGAVCMYLLVTRKLKDPAATFLYLGIFTFFPLWQFLFALNVDRHRRAVAIA